MILTSPVHTTHAIPLVYMEQIFSSTYMCTTAHLQTAPLKEKYLLGLHTYCKILELKVTIAITRHYDFNT